VTLRGHATLRAGDRVRVRSVEAILATLDGQGRFDGVPFMPEMFQFCGRQYRVRARAHKTCDTVNRTGGRRLSGTVHLDDLRCDGAAHGGCHAACLLFWKEAWLERLDGSSIDRRARPSNAGATTAQVAAAAFHDASTEADPRYVCQATQLPQFTTLLPWWDVTQYIEDVTSRNVSPWRVVRAAAFVAFRKAIGAISLVSTRLVWWLVLGYDAFQSAIGGSPYPRKSGSIAVGQPTPSRPLKLKPGEPIEVKSHGEILATLNGHNRNRGLYFDSEEVPYCGKQFRVRSEVRRIVDERTGRMLEFNEPSVILEGVVCQARYSDRRLLCPRAIHPFWRETWLRRVDPQGGPGTPADE
jgi:hypothetical protein